MIRNTITINLQKHLGKTALFILALLTVAFFVACGTLGNEETPEITPEYLSGAYAQQLVNDGAETLLGSVELSHGNSGDIEMILHPKEIVSDDSEETGYRIDSFALNRTFVLPDQAYIVYLPDGETEDVSVLTPSEFYQTVEAENEEHGDNFAEYGDHRLYDVYALDSQVLLLLAHYID